MYSRMIFRPVPLFWHRVNQFVRWTNLYMSSVWQGSFNLWFDSAGNRTGPPRQGANALPLLGSHAGHTYTKDLLTWFGVREWGVNVVWISTTWARSANDSNNGHGTYKLVAYRKDKWCFYLFIFLTRGMGAANEYGYRLSIVTFLKVDIFNFSST